MKFPLVKNFNIDKILDHSIKIYFQKFPYFIGLSILVHLPVFFIPMAMFDVGDTETYNSIPWKLTYFGVSLFATYILTSAVIRMSYETISNTETSSGFGGTLAVCIKYFIPILIAAVVMILIIVAGTCLLIVPGLIAVTRLYFTIPVVVMEGESPFKALSRSDSLTDGYRWHIFGLMTVVGLVNGAVTFVLALMFVKQNPSLYYNLCLLFAVFFTPFICIVQTVAYYHMRCVKEGVAIDELLKIFE